ncbi:MAG: YCF48-related protein [Ignavibacteriae bacterium]|nr:YCF48-related protein [Ignavibacteriota bacterium]
MKKLLVILVMLVAMNASGQWVTQYPYTAGVGLRDIEFINNNTGWICGDGIILKTTNMGVNWVQQIHPAPDKNLFSIHPVDSNIVFCVGWFETVLKTTNGGTNWIAIKNGTVGQGHSYNGVFFVNANTGWYAGTGNYIHKTTNGGLTFDSVYVLGDFKDIHFKDSNTGLIVGGGGSVYKTINGGTIWNSIYLPPNNYGDFRKVSVINNQYCFVVEDGKRVYKSTNYGDTWDSLGYVTGADQPYSCKFSSLQTGWVVGTFGEIFKSTNGGATWSFQYVNTSNIGWLRSLWFQNDSIGWVVGGNTKLLFTASSGATFVNPISTETPSKYSLSQNYPNPFNPTTNIKFSIVNSGDVKLVVYDIQGREVQTLVNESLKPGTYEAAFDGSTLNSGVYFYKLVTGNFTETKKMLLIK